MPAPDSDALVDCLNQRAIHHRQRGDAQAMLADARAALAQLGTPRAELQRARERLEAEGDWNPILAHVLALRSRAELALGALGVAEQHAQAAVASARRDATGLPAPASAWLGGALLAQARAEQARGDTAAARASLDAALAKFHEATGDDAPMAREARALRATL